jgi:cell pole-organizing protein PopZ
MSDDKTEQEPSIEEILHSIRQMIFEDGATTETAVAQAGAAETPPAPKAPAAEPPPVPEPKPEPVAAAEPPPPPPPASEPAPRKVIDADDGVLELTDKVAMDPNRPRIVMEEIEEMQEALNKDPLVSDMTAEAAVAAMAKLLSNNLAVERELPGRPGNVTLEDMARELMRPLIKTWLDQNLQAIIEKMVAREIERLSLRAMNEN